MTRDLASLASGLLFGLGLAVSQMMNPAKVLGFLDVAGAWDPSLALVMIGAVAVTLPAFRLVLKQPAPRLAAKFLVPGSAEIDAKLVGGRRNFWRRLGIGRILSRAGPGGVERRRQPRFDFRRRHACRHGRALAHQSPVDQRHAAGRIGTQATFI